MIKYFIFFALITLYSCKPENSREFKLNYKVSIEANDGKPMNIWIPIPQTNNLQTIEEITIDTKLDYQILHEKEHGNQYLYAHLDNGLSTDEAINMSFDVTRQQASITQENEQNTNTYLQANRLIPVGGRFDSLVQKNNFSPNNMKAVYQFILDEMYYGKPKSVSSTDHYYTDLPQQIKDGVSKDSVVALYNYNQQNKGEFTFGNGNANYACDIAVGNCTDFHSYFISLARTMKLPARFHIGFSIPQENSGTIGGYHCWADFKQNDKWVPVDISEADKNPEKADFYYENLDANRVEFTRGRDLILEAYTKGPVNFFVYPIVESGGEVYGYKKNFSYNEI